MQLIKVVLADDHPLVRSGIKTTLAGERDIHLSGEATNGNEAQALIREQEPHVLLLDLNMSGASPLNTLSFVKEASPHTKVLVLTAYDDESYIRGLVDAGCAGYLLKDEAAEALVHAIRTVAAGGTWFSKTVLDKMMKWSQDEVRHNSAFDLTKREREILGVMAQGWDNKRISEEFSLAEQTVRNYVSRIYDKLNMHTRAEVIVWAIDKGYADTD